MVIQKTPTQRSFDVQPNFLELNFLRQKYFSTITQRSTVQTAYLVVARETKHVFSQCFLPEKKLTTGTQTVFEGRPTGLKGRISKVGFNNAASQKTAFMHLCKTEMEPKWEFFPVSPCIYKLSCLDCNRGICICAFQRWVEILLCYTCRNHYNPEHGTNTQYPTSRAPGITKFDFSTPPGKLINGITGTKKNWKTSQIVQMFSVESGRFANDILKKFKSTKM